MERTKDEEEWETEGTVGLHTKPSKENKQNEAKQMRPELCCSEFGKNFSMTWVEGSCKMFIGLWEILSQYRFISP